MQIVPEEVRSTVDVELSAFRNRFQDLDFSRKPSCSHLGYAASLPIAQAMSANSGLLGPLFESSHRRYLGWAVRLIKAGVRYVSRPWLNVVMNHQKRMNSLTTSLAFEVAALQLKVSQLEGVLHKNAQQSSSRLSQENQHE